MSYKKDFEKLVESTSQLAKFVRAYYNNLLECGFSEKQEMVFAVQYQKDILTDNKLTKYAIGCFKEENGVIKKYRKGYINGKVYLIEKKWG